MEPSYHEVACPDCGSQRCSGSCGDRSEYENESSSSGFEFPWKFSAYLFLVYIGLVLLINWLCPGLKVH